MVAESHNNNTGENKYENAKTPITPQVFAWVKNVKTMTAAAMQPHRYDLYLIDLNNSRKKIKFNKRHPIGKKTGENSRC